MSQLQAVIGLEVHVRLATQTKLFCGCPLRDGDPPNTHVCEICLGLPGALPILNAQALRLALRAAIALRAELDLASRFSRKSYFYPDLAKGYQISQHEQPIGRGGVVTLDGGAEVALERLHIEEDAAKIRHVEGETWIDFNRAGAPLIEIVSRPVLGSAEEAEACLRALHERLVWAGITEGDLERGTFRCDANVSVHREDTPLGTRVELKNINSFRFVRRAIAGEIARQIAVLSAGGAIVQSTRSYDAESDSSKEIRTKEEADDYRYFDEPDLGAAVIPDGWIAQEEAALGEAPSALRERWRAQLQLSEASTRALSSTKEMAQYMEAVTQGLSHAIPLAEAAQLSAAFLQTHVLGRADALQIEASRLVELLGLLAQKTISSSVAKRVYEALFEGSESARAIVEREGLAMQSDEGALLAIAQEIVAANPQIVAQFQAGKTNVMGFFMGQLMKKTRGKADPSLARALFERVLSDPATS